jgi:hypothetical protein
VTATDELTAADLKLWLTLEAPDSPPCDGSVIDPEDDPCALEAVARVEWDAACDHWPDEDLLCSGHLGELRAELDSGRLLTCADCRKLVRVAAIGPAR